MVGDVTVIEPNQRLDVVKEESTNNRISNVRLRRGRTSS